MEAFDDIFSDPLFKNCIHDGRDKAKESLIDNSSTGSPDDTFTMDSSLAYAVVGGGRNYAAWRNLFTQQGITDIIEEFEAKERSANAHIKKLAQIVFDSSRMRVSIEDENKRIKQRLQYVEQELVNFRTYLNQVVGERDLLVIQIEAQQKTAEQQMFFERKFNQSVDENKQKVGGKIKLLEDSLKSSNSRNTKLKLELKKQSKSNRKKSTKKLQLKELSDDDDNESDDMSRNLSELPEKFNNRSPMDQELSKNVTSSKKPEVPKTKSHEQSRIRNKIGDCTIPIPVYPSSYDKSKLEKQIQEAVEIKKSSEKPITVAVKKTRGKKSPLDQVLSKNVASSKKPEVPKTKSHVQSRIRSKIGDCTIPIPVYASSCDKSKLEKQIQEAVENKKSSETPITEAVKKPRGKKSPLDQVLSKNVASSKKPEIPKPKSPVQSRIRSKIGDCTIPIPVYASSCDKSKLEKQIQEAVEIKKSSEKPITVAVKKTRGKKSPLDQVLSKNVASLKKPEVPKTKSHVQSRIRSKIGDFTIPIPVYASSCDKSKLEKQIQEAVENRKSSKKPITEAVKKTRGKKSPLDQVLSKNVASSKKPEVPKTKSHVQSRIRSKIGDFTPTPVYASSCDMSLNIAPTLSIPDSFIEYDSPLSPPLQSTSYKYDEAGFKPEASGTSNIPVNQEELKSANNFLQKHLDDKLFHDVSVGVNEIFNDVKHNSFSHSALAQAILDRVSMTDLVDVTVTEEKTSLDCLGLLLQVIEKAEVPITDGIFALFESKLLPDPKFTFNEGTMTKVGSFFGYLLEQLHNGGLGLGSDAHAGAQTDRALKLLFAALYWKPNRACSFIYGLIHRYGDFIATLPLKFDTNMVQNINFRSILFVLHKPMKYVDENSRKLAKSLRQSFKHTGYPNTTWEKFIDDVLTEMKVQEFDETIKKTSKHIGMLLMNWKWESVVKFVRKNIDMLLQEWRQDKITPAVVAAFISMIGSVADDNIETGDLSGLIEVFEPLMKLVFESSVPLILQNAIEDAHEKLTQRRSSPKFLQQIPVPVRNAKKRKGGRVGNGSRYKKKPKKAALNRN